MLKLRLTRLAEIELDQIHYFYEKAANRRIANRLILSITRSFKLFAKFPDIGIVVDVRNPKLESYNVRRHSFRYYNIYYAVVNNEVQILRVFDVRRNPDELEL